MKKIIMAAVAVGLLTVFSGCEDVLDSLSQLANTEECFDDIATQTGGERINAKDSADLPVKIKEILGTQSKVGGDVVFLIDKTGSMENDIESVKNDLTNIINALPSGTRVALATYGDKNYDGADWYSASDLSTDYSTILTAIQNITLTNGGDWPESVYDGLYETMSRMSWQSTSKRMILLIGDATALTGSDTDYTLEDVVSKSKESTPEINIYTILIEE